MKKFCSHKNIVVYLLIALTFFYSQSSNLWAVSNLQTALISQEVNNQTRNILTDLFKPKNALISTSTTITKNTTKTKSTTSIKSTQGVEIWGRVRQRLNLGINPSQPLYQRHVKSFAKHQDYINKVIKNASPYFFYILEEVERRGMPSEIALLPVIESDFNPNTRSNKGALGLWQIMPSLARMHGLKQNAFYDGRKDVYESTKVALDHLEYLHKKFNGNWLLAIAAYNCGEAKIQRAMRQNRNARKSTELWALKLPKETTHFVPKLLAFAAIIKSPKQYGVVLPTIPNKPVIARVKTTKSINIAHAAKLADVSETQLRRLNPGIKQSISSNGPFHLVVPFNDAHKFQGNVDKKIAPNKTAKAVETTIQEKGDITIVKSKKATTQKTAKQSKNTRIHIVRRGDNLPKISKKYHVNIKKILAYNNLRSASSIIQPGQKIIIAQS
ncbi:MAG: transglycosylase SLT domain-containing protein [Proteobacteria bacterium]|nr:transglycosylase SLT domain-containing protein [Pseudomonadota bacterium]